MRVRSERKALSNQICGKITDATYGEPTAIGKTLCTVVPAAAELDEPLESRNPFYDRAMMLEVGERLMLSEGA